MKICLMLLIVSLALCVAIPRPQNIDDEADDEEEPYQPATVPPDPNRRTTTRYRPQPTTVDPNEEWFGTQRPNVLQPGTKWTKRVKCVNNVCKTQTCVNGSCRTDDGNTMNEFDNNNAGWNFDNSGNSGYSSMGFQPSLNSGSSRQTHCINNVCQTRTCMSGLCGNNNGGSIISSDGWF